MRASGPPGHEPKLHPNMQGAAACAHSLLLLQMFCAKAASLLHGCTDNSCHCCGLLNLQSEKLYCFMAGLDNLIINNYDYAITAMAVPAASLASLAPGYAHAMVGLP